MFTELKKPRMARARDWDLEVQGIIADVDCYVRADPKGELVRDAWEALLLTQRLVDLRVTERWLNKSGRTWLDTWLYQRGGVRLYARRLCGVWTWADWDAIVPRSPGCEGDGHVTESGRPQGESSNSYGTAEALLKGAHRCASDWKRQDILQHLDQVTHARAAALKYPQPKSLVSELNRDGRAFTSRPCPPLSLPMLAFASELTANGDTGWHPAPDSGSFVHSSQLAPWRAGLVRSPLAERQEADAPLAVAVLVDRSGSTSYLLEPLWHGACALVKALRDVGHAAALDWWDDIGVQSGNGSGALLGWHETAQLLQPTRGSSFGGTELAKSCLPRMARLLATAPVGVRRVCVVITDGSTCAKDRVQFLEAAQAPCVYIVIHEPIHYAKSFLPPETEGWAARIASDGTDIMRDFSGEQLLAGLLQS